MSDHEIAYFILPHQNDKLIANERNERVRDTLCNVLTSGNISQWRSSSSYCYDFDTTLHVAELLPDLHPRVPPPRQDPVAAAEQQPGVQTRQQGLPQHQHDQPAEGLYAPTYILTN